MKKHYYFVIPIIIMVYLIYLIISETYKNYTENYKIENAKEANKETRNINSEIKNKIEYVATNAYKVKELKELGNALPWEKTIYLTEKDNIKQYIEKIDNDDDFKTIKSEKIYDSMTNYQKWIYLIFTKDIR